MAKSKKVAGIEIDVSLGLARVYEDVKTLNKTLTSEFSKINKVFSNLFAGAAIAGSLFGLKKSIDGIIGTMNALAEAGDRAGAIEEHFLALGGTASAIDAARKSTMGLVTSTDLMTMANKGLLADVPNLNENFALIANMGVRVGESLGVTATEGINQMLDAVTKASAKQLASLGIMIDVDKAYQDYAATLNTNVKYLNEEQQLNARRIATFETLKGRVSDLSEIVLGAADSHEIFKNALTEAYEIIGKQVDASPGLAKSWRDLANSINAINWEYVGEVIAGAFEKIVINAASAVGYIEDFARGLDRIFSLSETGKIANLEDQIQRLSDTLNSIKETQASIGFDPFTWFGTDDVAKDDLNKKLQEYDRLTEAARQHKDEVAKINEEHKKIPPLVKAEADQAKKAAQEIKKLREEWEKKIQTMSEDVLKENIETSLENLDFSGFERNFEALRSQISQGLEKDVQEALSAGLSAEQAETWRQYMIDKAITPIAESWEEKQKEANQESVDFWANAMENAITGVTFDLEDSLKQVAIGFASQIMASITGVSFEGGLKGLGQSLANSLISSASSSLMGSAMGSEIVGSAATASGEAGLLLADGSVVSAAGASSAASGGIYAVGAAAAAHAAYTTNEAFQGNATDRDLLISIATGGVMLAGALTGINSLFENSKDPQTAARSDVAGVLEEGIRDFQDKYGPLMLFDQSGGMSAFGGNIITDSFVGAQGWAQSYQQNYPTTNNTFSAVGEGLRQMNGVEEDIGAQIGSILADATGGNLDNIKMMLDAVGVSVQDLEAALLELGKTGEKSWQEIEVGLQGLNELNFEGLKGVGDLTGAFLQLEESGGRGMNALIAMQNISIEAMDLGIQTIDELGAHIVKQGILSAEEWEAFAEVLRGRGIETMEQLANAQERTLGGIVADLDSAGIYMEEWGDAMENVAESTKELADNWERVPREFTTAYQVNVSYNDPGGVPEEIATGAKGLLINAGVLSARGIKKFALGGVVNAPTMFRYSSGLGLIGEAGPEAVMPLGKNSNGELGVKIASASNQPAIVYNIDARGGTPGIEGKILNAIQIASQSAANKAIKQINKKMRY